MLLGFIAGILNKYIGAYFENIDASQLTGSIFGGGVTLHDINLRPSVLETLGIPLHIVAGKCGTLGINYSLTRLYSEPVTVTLKDLHILVIPARCVEYDESQDEKNKQDEKMRQLEIFESIKHHVRKAEFHRSQHRKMSGGKDHTILSDVTSLQPEASYFDMWVMTILRNILLRIESVHVRFEDDITKKEEPFAIGVTLEEFSVVTTDAAWKSIYMKEYAPETIYKLVKITGLSMYWNSYPTVMYKELRDNKLVFLRMGAIPKLNADDGVFKSMFGPVSLDLKIQVTPFPDNLLDPFSKPRLLVESSLDNLHVTASDKQFQDIIPFSESMDMLLKSHKHRKHRKHLHEVEYRGHYKEWWKYAYNCHIQDIRRRRNNFDWKVISEHRAKCKKYLRLYYKKKVEHKSGYQIETALSNLERDLDLFNIILLRKQAELIGARPEQHDAGTQAPQEPGVFTWLTSWVFWATPPQPPPPPVTEPGPSQPAPAKKPSSVVFSAMSMTREEKEELRIAVGFARNMDIGSCPDDYVAVEANALLNKFFIHIHDFKRSRKETILEAILDPVNFTFRSRPSLQNMEVELKMGRIEAYGGDYPKHPPEDIFAPPQLVTTANPAGSDYFLKLIYEKSPFDSEVDHRVSLEGLGLQFTYHADAIERLADCFTVPQAPPRPKTKEGKFPAGKMPAAKVLRKIMKFRTSSTAKLLRMMEDKGKVELSVCLISPYIVIPLDSSVRGKSNFVVVHLGEINVVGTIIGGTICEHGGCTNIL